MYFVLVTGEKDGLATSNQQQQSLIIEHKQEITMLEKELEKEQGDKSQLDKQLQELNEKLFASDCALDTLQQQIKQMNQTESISRARAQHESMLATMRQRHDEEVLTLKEKLDDIQQALAWKVEMMIIRNSYYDSMFQWGDIMNYVFSLFWNSCNRFDCKLVRMFL